MSVDLAALRRAVAAHGRVARVVIAETKGSVPRGPGTVMLVWGGDAPGQAGTIGGGALEFDATARARAVLAGAAAPGVATLPLGPSLGQCCGGSVTLVTEVIDAARIAEIAASGTVWARRVAGDAQEVPGEVHRIRARAARGTEITAPVLVEGRWMAEPVRHAAHTLWLHGAGHVGRAVAAVMAPLPDWAITWVDVAPERFPDAVPEGVDVLVAADPARAVAHAPATAHHLILTYSHDLDLALCDAVLRRGFASAGLIGSATKWARFRKRLAEAGHGTEAIARIASPIGDPSLGKEPQAIAIGVAAGLIRAGLTAQADAALREA